MRIRHHLNVLTVLLLLSAHSAAMADSSADASMQQPSGTSAQPNHAGKIARLPLAATSFVIGSIIGTPIAMVRHSADEINHAAKGMARGVHKPLLAPFFAIVGPTAVVLGGFGGAVEGPFKAVENSGANCLSKPFSKESFSLGPMEKWEADD